MFTLPFVISRSMLGVLMHDGAGVVATDELRTTDYLATYMTRLSDIGAEPAPGARARGKSRKKPSMLDPIEPVVANE
jgi:hypothetical protein